MREEETLCRPGGFALTDELLRFAGLEKQHALRLLDVGCGHGASVTYLRARFPDWRISGLDADPSLCREGICEIGRAEALPVPDQSLDVILMECSLSRIGRPQQALAEALRALRPDGWLLISDMYARKKELGTERGDADGQEAAGERGGLLGRLEFSRHIWKRLSQAGFSVLEMEDRSRALTQWIGQQILDGNGGSLDAALGVDRASLREAGCGYYVCAARPSLLWRLLWFVREKSPFYRERLQEAGIGEIAPGDWDSFLRIPFTTAGELREKPEAFLCVPPKEIARIITLRTSGSSGAPKRLFFTEDDLLRTADFFETGMQYLVSPGGSVTVYMEGPGFFSIGGLLKEGLGRIGVTATVHGLIRDMEAAAADGKGRDCLIGVPSQMYGLAVYAPWLRPKTVLLSADYVPQSVKEYLEKTWKCRVFTHWGMTETGYGGGVQCGARKGYHLRDRDLLLEIIDPQSGRPVPDGEYGELVLTTLSRRGMPLVRYRTGDWGRFLMDSCGCGCLKPRLEEVKGRLDDGVVLPDGSLLSIHRLDELLLSSGEIQDFRAEYDREKNRLTVTVMGREAGKGAPERRTEAGEGAPERGAAAAAAALLQAEFGGRADIRVESGILSPYIGSAKRTLGARAVSGGQPG